MRCIERSPRGRVAEAAQWAGPMVVVCVALIAMWGCKTEPVTQTDSPVVLCDDNNYAYTPELIVEQQQLRAGEDISITWPGVSQDIFGNPLDDDFAVDEVAIYVFGEYTPDEAVSGVLTESMMQREVDIFGYCAPTDDACMLSDFMLKNRFLRSYFRGIDSIPRFLEIHRFVEPFKTGTHCILRRRLS